MLEGIQVLHEIEKCTADSGNIIMGIVLGLFALLMLFMVILSIRDEDDLFGFFFIALLISGFFSLGNLLKYIGRIEYKEYKVTIDNEVSFKEFNERYEIINQEGEIYTIIEKNNE